MILPLSIDIPVPEVVNIHHLFTPSHHTAVLLGRYALEKFSCQWSVFCCCFRSALQARDNHYSPIATEVQWSSTGENKMEWGRLLTLKQGQHIY